MRNFLKTVVLFLSLLAGFTMAIPAPTPDSPDVDLANIDDDSMETAKIHQGWAEFYDDEHCKENRSIAFSWENDECINEPNRKSVLFRGKVFWSAYALQISPEKHCSCQSKCYEDFHGGVRRRCLSLTDYQGISYRFVRSACPCNDCPWQM